MSDLTEYDLHWRPKPMWLKKNIIYIMLGIVAVSGASYLTGFYGLFQ